MIFEVEVDVCVQRPPTPANTRTRRVVVQVDDDVCATVADIQAQCIAAQMASLRQDVEMPIATRIVSLEL